MQSCTRGGGIKASHFVPDGIGSSSSNFMNVHLGIQGTSYSTIDKSITLNIEGMNLALAAGEGALLLTSVVDRNMKLRNYIS
jgi:hypothetical protein